MAPYARNLIYFCKYQYDKNLKQPELRFVNPLWKKLELESEQELKNKLGFDYCSLLSFRQLPRTQIM